MWITIVALLLVPRAARDASRRRVNGSRRFLFGSSFQPSEFGKLAVVVWTSMLIVKKGDQLRRLTKGVLPFFVVIGVLDVLAALEPDLSVAMLYTLLMALLLFVGGVRIAPLRRARRARDPGALAQDREGAVRAAAHSRRSSIRAARRRR